MGARRPGQGHHRRCRLAARGSAAAVAAGGLLLAAVVAVAPPSVSASPSSEKTRVTQLEQRIAQQGQQVETVVSSYDQALAQEAQDTAKLQAAEAHLTSDQSTENQAMASLRALALQLYMNDSDAEVSLAIFQASNVTSSAAEQEYSDIANTNLRDTLDAVAIDVKQTEAAASALRVVQSQQAATVAQLGAEKQAAEAALAQDDATLSQAKSALAAELAQQAEQEAEQERAMAAAAAAETRPSSYSFTPSPGSYANPLRAVADIYSQRIDQGVDYDGYGPIYAVGDGQVMTTTSSGWPGGTFICYKLTNGPAAGLVMYAAEDIEPTVSVGQTVTAGTVLGNVYEGPNGIELGWADPSCDAVTMARDYGQFSGANSTAFGANYSQMLVWLGAPAGVMQNEPATGSLPPNWPQWP